MFPGMKREYLPSIYPGLPQESPVPTLQCCSYPLLMHAPAAALPIGIGCRLQVCYGFRVFRDVYAPGNPYIKQLPCCNFWNLR